MSGQKEMETEYETLANTVQKTLDNLQHKKDFLVDQQYNYNSIREKLLNFKQNKSDTSNDDDSIEQKGDIFGDIIISSNKIFLGIGYDYYIEKTVDEAIEFVEDKLKLMDDAIEQFDLRINEAKETLKNLKMLINKNQIINKSTSKDSKSDNEDTNNNNSNEEILPTMEIREELDEEGNVINGSVVPAATDEERQKIEDLISNKLTNKQEPIQEKKKVTNKQEPKIEEVHEKEEESEESNNIDSTTTNNVDTNEIYSFEDLVKQMDQQDEEDDGMIDSNDIDYNYDYSKLSNNISIGDEDEDEDEYYEEEYDDQIYNRMPGHSSFMDQLNKLRISRGQLEGEEEEIKEERVVKSVTVSAKEPEKSIMKITTQEESETVVDITDEKKKSKKSVGFAESLDVHEVESFKKETKQQTFKFPRQTDDLYSMVQDMMTDDTNNPNLNEFDNDLFASMIGAKPSDELHDKYKDQLNDEIVEEQEEQESKKKVRVSRFKKDRGNVRKSEPVVQDKDIIEEIDRSGNRAVVDTIVERDVAEVEIEPKPKKKLSRFAQNRQSKQQNPKNNSQGIVKDKIDRDEPKESEGIVRDIIDRDEPKKAQGVVKDITDRDDDIAPSDSKIPHFQKKKMGSLNKPRQSLNKTPKFPEELLDDDNELESDEDNEPTTNHNKPVIPTPKIEEIVEDEKEIDDDLIFPKEVKEAIKKMGKTEDSLRVANVDYSMLVDNMDDMIQAYSLGMYDDDLEEHPGTVVEKIEDFTTYNKQVDELKDDIIDFKKNNPMVDMNEEVEEEDDEEDPNSNVIMTDIVEKDIPINYRDIEEEYENNLGLHPDNISEAVNKEYHTLRQRMLQQMQNMSISDDKKVQTQVYNESLEIEPIDTEGNPIKVSRFKSQRMKLDNPMNK